MRDKISTIMADGAPPPDSTYDRVCAIPNVLDSRNFKHASALNSSGSAKDATLFTQVRALARSLEIAAKRYNNLGVLSVHGDSVQDDEEQAEVDAYTQDDRVGLEDATVEGDENDEPI